MSIDEQLICPTRFQYLRGSSDLPMAYSKAKLKNNGDKAVTLILIKKYLDNYLYTPNSLLTFEYM
jgi:hypothetical protein